MPAEGLARPQRVLEVHRRARGELAERGQRQCFPRHVGRESAAADLDRSQAGAVDGDAVADGDAHERNRPGSDAQPHVAADRFDAGDAAYALHDAREHASPPSRRAAGP